MSNVKSIAVLLLGVCLLVGAPLAPSEVADAQSRRSRRPTTSTTIQKLAIDYSRFSHATSKHQAACQTCHKIPTSNWQKARDFPDITDFPDHDACVSCHRQQFFRGARPVICGVCHVKVSPRDEARFAFRNSVNSLQFNIEFPHDKHQDVIARLRSPFDSERAFQFRPASFEFKGHTQGDKSKTYNNCTICHASRIQQSRPPAGGWIDSFVPDPDTFKSVPASHASCFSCHWKSQPPVNSDCAGCHKLTEPYKYVGAPKRISMKFRHAREQHVAECTTCHINITKASTLRGLTPDVPITSCTECHNKDGLRLDVAKELAAIDKNRAFVCTYCHTSDKGRLDPPRSHYLISEREPVRRSGIR